MKRSLLLLCLFATLAKAQSTPPNPLLIGTAATLHSQVLKEDQQYWVSLPSSYNDPHYAKTKYPVIYVFDGDENLATVSAMTGQLGLKYSNTVIPEVIVVGVMHNNRSRDLTPYPSSFWMFDTPLPFKDSGGGEKFISYLQNELMPHIDSVYSTAAYKVLIGHSLGGLEAVNILVNHTTLFNSYIIIDPSLWWDNQKFMHRAEQVLHQKRFDNVSLYLGIANNLPDGMDTVGLMRDTLKSNLHMRSIFQFRNELLKTAKQNGLHFNYKYYTDDTHMSVPLISEYDGLRFIFDFYHLPLTTETNFYDTGNTADPAQVLTSHFQEVSKHFGYTVKPPEPFVFSYGTSLAGSALPDKAISLLLMNTRNYPASAGAWIALADTYSELKNTQKAIEAYQKALSLRKDVETVKKLEQLLKAKKGV